MAGYALTPAAQADLSEIWDYTAEKSLRLPSQPPALALCIGAGWAAKWGITSRAKRSHISWR